MIPGSRKSEDWKALTADLGSLEDQPEHRVVAREAFLNSLRAAVRQQVGFAAGRIGISEKHWMYHPILLEQGAHSVRRKVFESRLRFHASTQVGIFPTELPFLAAYNDFFVEHVRNLDYLGLVLEPVMDPEIVRFYEFENPILYYKDLAPERSSPSRPEQCYLPSFEGRDLLIVCPFADLLAERATRETFEAVWAKTGKQWFFPRSVTGLNIPYGFSRATREEFETSLDLFQSLSRRIEARDFDVALIGASGLSIPLISLVKSLGKVGLHFGGDIQILFGVIGQRWRDRSDWQEKYFNASWIDMPERYRPAEADSCNGGAYW